MSELPRLLDGLLITPFDGDGHASARFLVETGRGSFVVNGRMRCLIESLSRNSSMAGLKAQIEGSLGETVDEQELSTTIAGLPPILFDGTAPSAPKTPFHLSFRFLSAELVQAVARFFRFLYSPAVLAIIGCALTLELPWLLQAIPQGLDFRLGPGDFWLFVLAVGATALFHEAGHAAACAWYGVPPGEIGFGLYLIFPSFYTNVTKAWRLSRYQRTVVDVGGIYFQLILIAALVPLAHVSGHAGLLSFLILYNLYMILHNLNPLFKMDGYWIFSDLAGLPNLHRRTWSLFRELGSGRRAQSGGSSPWGPARQILVYGYAIAVLGYAAFLATTLPRWYARQFAPYPAIVAACFHDMVTAGDFAAGFGAFGRLLASSVVPALMVVLPLSWLMRGVRNWRRAK